MAPEAAERDRTLAALRGGHLVRYEHASFALRGLDGSTVVVASGEIDLATSPALGLALLAATETSSKLVVDLTAVTFLDGAGLRVLLGCSRDLPDGGSMSLVGVNDTVARVLRLTQLDEVFPVHPNAAAAVNGVADG